MVRVRARVRVRLRLRIRARVRARARARVRLLYLPSSGSDSLWNGYNSCYFVAVNHTPSSSRLRYAFLAQHILQ